MDRYWVVEHVKYVVYDELTLSIFLVLKWTFYKEPTGKLKLLSKSLSFGFTDENCFLPIKPSGSSELDFSWLPQISVQWKPKSDCWMSWERIRVFFLSLCVRLYLWQQVNFSTATTPKWNVHCGSFFLDSSGLWWCFLFILSFFGKSNHAFLPFNLQSWGGKSLFTTGI